MALDFLRSARTPPCLVVMSSEELEASALVDWLERFDDQDFSFTDAVSFAVMLERGIKRALTLDTHLAIAGFEIVPRLP